MPEIMYNQSSILIVGLLLLALLAAIESGFRYGRKASSNADEALKGQVNTIQGSLLGLLALLLGFTFSQALQRYDARSNAVVAEANAIGTALLRIELLPQDMRSPIRSELQRYLDLRISSGNVSLDKVDERAEALRAVETAQRDLWELGAAAISAPQAGIVVQGLNGMFDAYTARNAALDRHVPEIVLFLLFSTFLLTACLVGYSSGVSRNRASFPTYVLVLLITTLVFIIIDLDRPRRGVIEVSQQPLLDLSSALSLTRSGQPGG